MLRFVCVVSTVTVLLVFTNLPSHLPILLGTIGYLFSGGWKWLKLVSKTFKRDIHAIALSIMMIYKIITLKKKNTLLKDVLSKYVKKYPDKLAFVSADTNRSLTFQETEQMCHKIANVFYDAGYRKGDVIALMMENRIEYMPIWIGLSTIGVITSLINYNLRGKSLKYSIDVCKCKGIIFSEEMILSLKEIENELDVEMYCFERCESTFERCKYLESLMESSTDLPPTCSQNLMATDTALYMYTSGTTGLPKAVIWRGDKNMYVAMYFAFVGITEEDILYQALPLYHLNGMIMASTFLLNGCTTVIKKKFSASQYMEDCCKYNITIINYIGEICRYLLSQPKCVFDKMNNIRLALGNGLRASIWTEFKERFMIQQIIEFYGSTEGNTRLIANGTGRVGAVGYRPILFPNHDLKLVKMNKETGEIIRGIDGLAVEAEYGEPGQAVGKIDVRTKFDGYTNKEDTQKKIAYDIFTKGDSAYLSGDMLARDEEGYYYFRDRIGDTFRWKGENVSTNEVEGLISNVLQLTDVCVYGVEIPGIEGKAGMACICDPDKKVNIEHLPESLDHELPKYAQPVFLRLTTKVDVTATFKFLKKKLRTEGFNPQVCSQNEKMYYFSNIDKKYHLLDSEKYEEIVNGNVRF